MVKVCIEHKNTGYFLQTAAYLLNLIVILTIIVLEIGDEVYKIKDLFLTKTVQATAVFGSILLIILAFTYLIIKGFGFLMYATARKMFGIYSDYKIIYRIALLCNIVYVLGALIDKLFISQTKDSIWLFLVNPFFILATAMLFYFCRSIFQATQIQSLLFSALVYLIFFMIWYLIL
ncbi:hypothetical protein BC351_38430 [Paenibacillus ferrarius]|uniref:Yip1 domain-containing protein n=1 Tax=Paenibacillus ferrarius TaxID=1469647 RepID=A0A1V4HBB5_9BACL|nr:hypothetical protein [Paenibacillus ferrarius]OPH48276.1 hypothetical protein BC351_38430 [Paenibacillus ferrarius]